jgi:hypothetical protein
MILGRNTGFACQFNGLLLAAVHNIANAVQFCLSVSLVMLYRDPFLYQRTLRVQWGLRVGWIVGSTAILLAWAAWTDSVLEDSLFTVSCWPCDAVW